MQKINQFGDLLVTCSYEINRQFIIIAIIIVKIVHLFTKLDSLTIYDLMFIFLADMIYKG